MSWMDVYERPGRSGQVAQQDEAESSWVCQMLTEVARARADEPMWANYLQQVCGQP
jgi:hypothetical protein